MRPTTAFDVGLLAGMLATFAAFGVHWLITPARRPDTTPFEFWATVAGIVVCIAVFVVLAVRFRGSPG